MDYTIRPARMEDHGSITSFTRDTFSWGDYVTRVYKDWIADPRGLVLVAADRDDRAVAMGKVTLVSATEAWAQGARVDPDHRRRGLSTLLTDELCAWAAERGGRVVRLVVEEWNEPARAQVRTMGFRPVGHWAMAERVIGVGSPVPEGDGGRRVPAADRLRPVPSGEADAAFLSWASGPLARAARDLCPFGWRWRRLDPADLAEAARRDALLESRHGWVVAEPDEEELVVSWVETGEDDAHDVLRAAVDTAQEYRLAGLHVKVPAVDWLLQPLRRLGCEIHAMAVYARPL